MLQWHHHQATDGRLLQAGGFQLFRQFPNPDAADHHLLLLGSVLQQRVVFQLLQRRANAKDGHLGNLPRIGAM